MNLVQELENDIAIAMVVNNKFREKLDSKEILSLVNKVRGALESVSQKNHIENNTKTTAAV